MSWVVDSSVAVKWLVLEDDSTIARRLIGETLIAPDLLFTEVANAAWKKWKRKEIPVEVAQLIPSSAASFVSLVPTTALTEAALMIALELEHPVYDCHYLALAERTGLRVMTADKRLVSRRSNTRWQAFVALLSEHK